MRRARVRGSLVGIVALSLAALAITPVPGSAAELPICRVLDFSPDFAKDGTAFCAEGGAPRRVVYRTTDRGRSWTRVGADSPWLPDGASVTQVMVSADFARDRTVYVATTSTVYVSTDAGESFLPADLLSGESSGRRVFTPYLDTTSGLAYLAFGSYQSPARLRPPVREPVGAALPAKTGRFLLPSRVSTDSDPLLLAFDGSGASLRSTVYGCTARLDCLEARGSFAFTAENAWRSPRYATDRSLYFVTQANGFTFLRSTDGGRTITPFSSLNRAIAPFTAAMRKDGIPSGPPSMAFGPHGRIYVRLHVGIVHPGKPQQVVLRSDDNGKRWKQVAVQYEASRRGSLPFTVVKNAPGEIATGLYAAPDGRLFAMGEGMTEAGSGPWCSVDGGVRWYRTCPR